MKKTSAELKRQAREHLRGHYALPIGAFVVANLIIGLIPGLFSLVLDIYNSPGDLAIYEIVNFVVSLVSMIFTAGLTRIHLKLSRNEIPQFSDLFCYFTRRPDRFILGGLLMALISIGCLIPGAITIGIFVVSQNNVLLAVAVFLFLAASIVLVILSLCLNFVFILMADHDDMGVIAAFRESFRLMQGNKGRLFYIILSFIGWEFLCLLSFGIGLLWLQPYMTQTSIEFYRDVIGERDNPISDPYENDTVYTEIDSTLF